jgi:hypothetical protein
MRCDAVTRSATPIDASAMKRGRRLMMSARVLVLLLLGAVLANTRPAFAQGIEIEPNDPCSVAQDVGEVALPFTMSGNLDSTDQVADVDFFRFSGAPGFRVRVDLEGAVTGKGTLEDPVLGFFDAACNLIEVNDDGGVGLNSKLALTIPDDGVFILAATAYPDFGFLGGGVGNYEITVAPFLAIGSISGRIVDALSGSPLPGDTEPFAFVRLLRCEEDGCFDVSQLPADQEGRFLFDRDFSGQPLEVGTYQVVAFANQYFEAQTDPFAVGENEERDIGDIPLEPFPVQLSNISPCGNIPAKGGTCKYSVTVANRSGTRLDAEAWSLVQAFDIGSFTGFTEFQAGLRQLTLQSEDSKQVRFEFRVPSEVRADAFICTNLFVSRRRAAFFDTVGASGLFCITKEEAGFSIVADKEAQQIFRQTSGQALTPPK